MGKTVAVGQTNVSVRMKMLTIADGSDATGISHSSTGHQMAYQRGENTASVDDATASTTLSAITDAHADWAVKEISSSDMPGWYRCDFPDACFAAGVGDVTLTMQTTAETCVAVTVTIEPLFKFQGLASAATGTTTTFAAGPVPYKGDVIYVAAGTGIGQSRVITSVASQVATHVAWDTNISTSSSTILLIGGDAFGANADVLSSTLSTLGSSDLDAETSTVTALLPSELSDAGYIKSDVKEIADVAITGGGIELTDEWRPE